jgi:hypothetical protein
VADHGAVGQLVIDGTAAGLLGLSQVGPGFCRGLVDVQAPANVMYLNSGRDDAIGNPLPPGQKQGRPGILTGLLIPITAGARQIFIDVLQEVDVGVGLRPRMTLKANADVGLHSDLVVDAAAGVAWQTLTAAFTATGTGAVEVWREKRYQGMDDAIWWDNLRLV